MGKEILTKEQAISLIGGERDSVHSFKNPAPAMLIGCDILWKDFLVKLDEADCIEAAGDMAVKMNHPVCLTKDGSYEFIGKG